MVQKTFFGDDNALSELYLELKDEAEHPRQAEQSGDFRISGTMLVKYVGNAEKVIIPEGIESINDFAFDEEAATVRSIYIPDSVKVISSSAFQDCGSLRAVRLPAGLKVLETCLFCNCVSLEQVEIPDSLETIQECAFYNCPSMQSVHLPDSVRFIGTCAFYGCSELQDLRIPETVEIQEFAFKECRALAGSDQYVTIHHVVYDYFGEETEVSLDPSVRTANRDIYDEVEENLTGVHCALRQIPDFPEELKHLAARTYLVSKETYDMKTTSAWEAYISQEQEKLLPELVENDDAEAVRGLTAFASLPEQLVNDLISRISGRGQTAVMAILLDYRNTHYDRMSSGMQFLDDLKF